MEIRNDLEFNYSRPEPALADFVESFWMLSNHAEAAREIVVLPDGRIDISFSHSSATPFHGALMGLESAAHATTFAPGTVIFAVSLRLLGVEYLWGQSISNLVYGVQALPDGFWDIGPADLQDFEAFCSKITAQIKALIPPEIDERKRKLLDCIYATQGALTVKQYSENVFWESRQINRYFNQQFGLSLKAYCTILRFRASFKDLKVGKLSPTENYADQAHFIKEIKKFAGVVPKTLAKNENDRFIQFSVLPPE